MNLPNISAADQLSVLVVGGGLAGLAAAGWLRKQHRVVVLERGRLQDSSRNDYGMSIVANAMKLLHAEGIDLEALESVLFTHTWMHNSDNSLIKAQLFDTTSRFGCSSIFTRRARLHAELLRLATSPSGVGAPAIIIEDAKVIEIDPLQGLVKLNDGREFQGDILVGADGINSAVRGAVLTKQPSTRNSTLAKPTGVVAIMSTIPIECIRSDPELSSLVANGKAGLSMYYGPSNLRASFFPMDRNGNVQLVGSIPEAEWKEQFERENSSIIKNVDLLHAQALFKDFHPSLVKLFGASTSGTHDVWRIRDIDPLDSWSCGRSVLIGDAAHAVTPHIGQGCNIAVEDAEALGFLLRDIKKGDWASITHAFTTFETLRKSRTTYIQLTSRLAGGMLEGEEAAAIGPFNPTEFSKAVYSYSGAEDALAELLANGPAELPNKAGGMKA